MIQLSLECWVAANMHKILIEKDLHHVLGSHGQHTGLWGVGYETMRMSVARWLRDSGKPSGRMPGKENTQIVGAG